MKNNPLIPYILIMAFGIGLIFFLSLEGAGSKDEAHGDEGGAASVSAEPFHHLGVVDIHR